LPAVPEVAWSPLPVLLMPAISPRSLMLNASETKASAVVGRKFVNSLGAVE
jgi:hypothetical protein